MKFRIYYLLPLFFIFSISCEKDAIDLETFGSIEGFVLNSETEQPVANASITTTPPTNSILSREDGTFRFEEIPTGSYSIQVRKSGFKNNSVSVTVRENKAALANIPLTPVPEEEEDPDEDDNGESDDDGDGDNGGS